MELHQEKDRMLQILTEVNKKPYIRNHEKIMQGLCELQNDIQGDFYTIVVLGEFKRGKSTLVNALLGTRLLPMDVLPETATINAIMYEEKPKLVVVNRDGSTRTGEVSYDFLKQYSAREEGSDAENVRYIKIGYPCELLKNRIVLVDTPGVSDLNEQRSEVTYQFVPKSNAVLFVLDANAPLKKTEKEFIDERLLPLGINNILFIVNKYDAVDEDEEEGFLDKVKKRLHSAFQMNAAEAQLRDITVYPLSAKMALQGIETGNEKLIKASGFEDIKAKLSDMLFEGKVEQEKLQGYRKRLHWLLTALDREIQSEKSMKSASITELEDAAFALRQMLEEKTSEDNNVAEYVNSAKSKIYAMADKSLQHFHGKLKDNIFELVDGYQSQDFKNFIEKAVPKHIQRNIESWIGVYAPHVDELLALMERELARGLSYRFNQKIRLEAEKGNGIQNMGAVLNIEADDISNTGLQAGAITAVGAVAIMAVLNPILVPILSIWGRSKIFDSLLKKKLAAAKADVVPQVESQLGKTMLELRAHIHSYIDKRCVVIQKNTQNAYEFILSDIQKQIEAQIEDKKQAGKNVQKEMDELAMQSNEIHSYMLKLCEEV